MRFKTFYSNILIQEATVDIFDDVKSKTTKEIFKVVDILVRGGQRFFRLAPVNKSNAREFDVDNKTFNQNYITI